ncbi:MAG: nucleotidyltransferase domain-containing protein [Anaerolineae bacterium]
MTHEAVRRESAATSTRMGDAASTRRLTPSEVAAQIDALVACLARYQPQQVWLLGSFARGDYHAASDLDLVIIKETDQPFVERAADVWRACGGASGITQPIEPLVYTPAEFARMRADGNPLIERVLREGRCIYGQERA